MKTGGHHASPPFRPAIYTRRQTRANRPTGEVNEGGAGLVGKTVAGRADAECGFASADCAD